MRLKLLWELQELDLAISTLREKIEEAPRLSGVEEASEHLESLRNELFLLEENLKDKRKILKQLEMKTQKIVDDRKELNENLYSGKVTNVKELEQMHRKMDLLAAEKKNLEDDIINFMESIEELESNQESRLGEISEGKNDLEDKNDRLASDLNQYKLELKQLEEERELQERKIDKKDLDRYDILIQKHQGKALARVVDDICEACRVIISSAQRGHLYNPGTMVYCENCGRLLVKFDQKEE